MRIHACIGVQWCFTTGSLSTAVDSFLAAIMQNVELLLQVFSDETCPVEHHNVLRAQLV